MSECYYCGEVMKDENLKKHCQLKHNAAKRIAGEASVSGFFASSAKKSKTTAVTSDSTSTDLLLTSGGHETPEGNICSRPETPSEDAFAADVMPGHQDVNTEDTEKEEGSDNKFNLIA